MTHSNFLARLGDWQDRCLTSPDHLVSELVESISDLEERLGISDIGERISGLKDRRLMANAICRSDRDERERQIRRLIQRIEELEREIDFRFEAARCGSCI